MEFLTDAYVSRIPLQSPFLTKFKGEKLKMEQCTALMDQRIVLFLFGISHFSNQNYCVDYLSLWRVGCESFRVSLTSELRDRNQVDLLL